MLHALLMLWMCLPDSLGCCLLFLHCTLLMLSCLDDWGVCCWVQLPGMHFVCASFNNADSPMERGVCRYVMDVYMPRDRMNRAEHRGFGFVTFETEAAILRVASYGGHMIR